MTWNAQFEITNVEEAQDSDSGTVVHAVATVGDESEDNPGTLNQNTEHVVRMKLKMEMEPGHETALKAGDRLNGWGNFTG